jgi:hypothetical protein
LFAKISILNVLFPIKKKEIFIKKIALFSGTISTGYQTIRCRYGIGPVPTLLSPGAIRNTGDTLITPIVPNDMLMKMSYIFKNI